MLALLAARLSERYPVPAPALFLLASLALPVALPHIRTVERIGVVAVVLILFDGGMNIGWRRFRRAVVPIASLGIVGTFTTAVLVAGCAHLLIGLSLAVVGALGGVIGPAG